MLVEKSITLQLSSPERISKLICVSLDVLLVVKARTLTLYSIGDGKEIASEDVGGWEYQGKEGDGQGYLAILDAVYHRVMGRLLLLLGRNNSKKHQNWIFISTPLSPTSTSIPDTPSTHLSFQQNPTKFQQMQLQPRLIPFPSSPYFAFLRNFYNDSMVTVFRGQEQLYSFFVNQENMGPFDDYGMLVSFRAIFGARLGFSVFGLVGDREERVRVEVDVEGGGTIVAIRKKDLPQNEGTKQPQVHFQAILAINLLNRSTNYLLYSNKQNQLTHLIPTPNSILLSFFPQPQKQKLLTLQYTGNRMCLVYEGQGKGKRDLYEVEDGLEEWEIARLGGHELVVMNYSQSVRDQKRVLCRLYRNAGRKEMRFVLARQMGVEQSIIPTMLQLYEH